MKEILSALDSDTSEFFQNLYNAINDPAALESWTEFSTKDVRVVTTRSEAIGMRGTAPFMFPRRVNVINKKLKRTRVEIIQLCFSL